MARQDDIKNLIRNHNRRLQKLKEQQALHGLDAPPKILLEIMVSDVATAAMPIYPPNAIDCPRNWSFYSLPIPNPTLASSGAK